MRGTELRFSARAVCLSHRAILWPRRCGFGLAIASNLLGKGKDSGADLYEGDDLSFVRNS